MANFIKEESFMVCILLGTGFEEAEAIVPADLLRRAELEVRLVSLSTPIVVSSHGIAVRTDIPLKEVNAEEVELLFLPGGLGGVSAIQNCPAAMELIQNVAARGKFVTAICAAPIILGKLGLLQGRKAVCYPGMEKELTGADIQFGAPFVQDGNFVTGEASGSVFAFGLKLVECLKGRKVAEAIRASVFYHGDF